MNWQEYEKALFIKLLSDFPVPDFIVDKNEKIWGRFSKSFRKIDVTVRRNQGTKFPLYLIFDAKKRARKLNVKDVEMVMGQMEDVGAPGCGIVTTKGFTKGAQNRAWAAKNTLLKIMGAKEALEINLRELAQKNFPLDWIFWPQIATALKAIDGNDVDAFIKALESVAYEEWNAVVRYSFQIKAWRPMILKAIRYIAQNHYDSGWRFNTIQLLDEWGVLKGGFISTLLLTEEDPETRELLEQLSGRKRRIL